MKTPHRMSKHTPGPWSASDENMGTIDIKHHIHGPGAISLVLARVTARKSWISESKSNACLISAAPELLEALLRCKFESLNMSPDDMAFCRAAIAKAKGEQA